MGLFDDVLGSGESLFKNEDALEYEFLPKILPFREREQRELAGCIAPLLQGRNGRNVLVHGAPGIGKTAAARAVLREVEEKSEDVSVVYLNCWHANTTYKVYLEICDQLGYKFTQNKNSTDLLKVLTSMMNKRTAVLVFDEIDKAEEFDFLYGLVEELFKKSLILITNYKSWLLELDERVKSRVMPELIEFRQYDAKETREILKQRLDAAFVPGVWEPAAFDLVAERAATSRDIRAGLFLLKQAGQRAESVASKKVTAEHVRSAVAAIGEFTVKSKDDLGEEEQFIFDLIKKQDGAMKMGDVYNEYKRQGGKASYKTFQRKIAALDEGRFISLERKTGDGGNTTLVNRKITDY